MKETPKGSSSYKKSAFIMPVHLDDVAALAVSYLCHSKVDGGSRNREVPTREWRGRPQNGPLLKVSRAV